MRSCSTPPYRVINTLLGAASLAVYIASLKNYIGSLIGILQ